MALEKESHQKLLSSSRKTPRISIITCTGGRPEAFSLLEKYISNQTFKDFEWIVIDDVHPPTKCTKGQKYFRGPELWSPDNNTQRVNLNLALEKVTGDFIFIVEDDDYYAPTYLQQMLNAFTNSSIVGLSNARYYRVNMPGYAILRNYQHASLSQTAISKTLLPMLKRAVNSGQFYIDIELWKKCREEQVPMTLIGNTNLSIGIKGMPGREGLTPPHKENNGFFYDAGHKVLSSWIGSAAQNYVPYLKKSVARSNNITYPDTGRI